MPTKEKKMKEKGGAPRSIQDESRMNMRIEKGGRKEWKIFFKTEGRRKKRHLREILKKKTKKREGMGGGNASHDKSKQLFDRKENNLGDL